RRATLPGVGIRKVKPDPGELILWDCGVVNNIEASTIKTQQYRLLLRIYRQVSPQTRSLRTLLAVLHEVQASLCCVLSIQRSREHHGTQEKCFYSTLTFSRPPVGIA